MTRPLWNTGVAAALILFAAPPRVVGASSAFYGNPLFSRCDIDAGSATREGRSVMGATREAKPSLASKLSLVTPGLLAFGLEPEGWRRTQPLGARGADALACPSGAKP